MYRRTEAGPVWNAAEGGRLPPREPSYRRERVRVPINYSGNAFRSEDTVPPPPAEEVRPHFEDLPRVSDLPVAALPEVSADPPEEAPPPPTEAAPASAGALPFLNGKHFPFGHGLGYEELFLLGLMVFLLKEGDGEGDVYETLLLLGVLLLCG